VLEAKNKTAGKPAAKQPARAPAPAPGASGTFSFQLFTQISAGPRWEETEARGAAERVVRGSGAPVEVSAGNGLAVSRAPVGEAGAAPGPLGVIVEDGMPVGPGQVARAEFYREVAEEIRRAATEELAQTGHQAADCPYLAYWLDFYGKASAARLERVIQRYARPAAPDPASIRESTVGRVRTAVRLWASTGRLSAVPVENLFPGEKPDAAVPKLPAPAVQTKSAVDGARPLSPASSPAAIQGRLGAGHSLDGSARSQMERGFGRSFEGVRVHTDETAAALSTTLSARAFTVGRHIAFARDQYRPGTLGGDLLLAHELAHVVQQTGAEDGAPPDYDASSILEREADQAAADLALGEPAQAAQTSRLRLQRCGGTVDYSRLGNPPDYDAVVAELRSLYAQKEAIAKGQASLGGQAEVDQKIDDLIAQLRFLGIRSDKDRIQAAITKPGGVEDLRKIGGVLVRTPPGPAYVGQRMTFTLYQDYVPPGRTVKLKWRWTYKDGKDYDVALGSGFPHGESITLDDFFWNVPRPREWFAVFVEIYLGDEKTPAGVVSTGHIQLEDPTLGKLEIEPSSKIAIKGAPVDFKVKGFSLTWEDHYLEWYVNGTRTAKDLLVLTQSFDSTGKKNVSAKIYQVKRGFWGNKTTLLNEASTEVDVQEPGTVGEQALAEAAKQQAPVDLKGFEESIRKTLPEIANYAAMGGEQKEYWNKRYEAQQERLKGIAREVPYFKEAKDIPPDPSALDESAKYSSPVPAVIVYPKAGVQPITIYLSAEKKGSDWSATLIDATGKKVLPFRGSGPTALDAFRKAFEDWEDRNPYPTGGTVVYTFNPKGWTFKKTFSTTDFGKQATEFIDDVIMVGGIIVAGLLLAAPDATLTKWLGFGLLALSVGRSIHKIYQNMSQGADLLDRENIIEGLSIITAFMGAGGTVMRSIGAEARAVRPLLYRAGNSLVIASLAGDVGTLVLATDDAIAALRAARGDPTLDEGARNAQILRVISSLLMSGTLMIVSNRSLFKELSASEFIKTRLPASAEEPIGQATRLDIELEMRKAGADPVELRKLSNRDLLGQFLLMQRRQTATRRAAAMRETLSDAGKVEFDAMRAQHDTAESFAAALEKVGDPKPHFEELAAKRKADEAKKAGAGGPPAAPPVAPASPPPRYVAAMDRLRALDPASKIEIAPDQPLQKLPEGGMTVAPENQIRINGEIDIHPNRLAELSEQELKDLLKGTRELAAAGGDFSKLSKESQKLLGKLSSSGGARLRFEYQRRQAGALLESLGVKDHPLFEKLSDADRNRLYDLIAEAQIPGAPNAPKQAASYAVGRASSPREFVEHFQFYLTQFKERVALGESRYQTRLTEKVAEWEKKNGSAKDKDRSRIESELDKELGVTGRRKDWFRGQAEKEMAGAQAGTPSDKARKDVGDAYDQLVKDIGTRKGGGNIDAGLPPDQVVAKIKGLPEVTLGSESAAAYHTAKHYPDLPPSEQKGKPFADYMASAQATIQNPTKPVAPPVSTQEGAARSFVFIRELTEGGKTYKMMAIVVVTNDGKVVLATYMAL
jgi:hypothetical protein